MGLRPLRFSAVSILAGAGLMTSMSYSPVAAQTVAAPTISSFTPASGPEETSVTITGTNLTGITSVVIGTKDADSFSVDSDTQITAVVAPGAATGPVTVTTSEGLKASSATSFTVTAS